MRLQNLVFAAAVLSGPVYAASEAATPLQQADFSRLFGEQVTRTATLSADAVANYQTLLTDALSNRKLDDKPQFYVVVDRNPAVQVLSLFVGTLPTPTFVGAAPVATGTTGRFDHYITPVGVYEHTLLQDFRAEGTKNSNGIRGYGSRGMRVWDFGWYPATKGWKGAAGETGNIRFQMHATDPGILEPKLGKPASKGCVRVPESLNKFMDRYGVLDAVYESAAAAGTKPWVWNKAREAHAFSGRYIVVVDTSVEPVGL
jgi:hypothetical protein